MIALLARTSSLELASPVLVNKFAPVIFKIATLCPVASPIKLVILSIAVFAVITATICQMLAKPLALLLAPWLVAKLSHVPPTMVIAILTL
jgi:hypothetical protein